MAVSYQIHWLDYVMFTLVLALTSSVGLFFALTGNKQQTTKEYFSGNRSLKVLPSSFSIVASFMSAIMIIGVPAEAYLYGGQYFLASVGTAIGTLFATFVFVPVFYPLRLMSNNQYLQMRYKSVYPKYFSSIVVSISLLFYAAIVIYAPSSSIATLTGVPVTVVILVSSAIAIFFTSIGGIKAVVWTDTFLCLCMISGMLMVSVQGIKLAGGFREAWNLNIKGGRLAAFSFSPDPVVRLTVWNLIIGMAIDSSRDYGITQSAVIRYSNVKTLFRAKLTVLLSLVGNAFMYILPVISGLAIYAYYAKVGCDPIKSGIIEGPNELVPHFVMETLNIPGIPGLFLASLSGGALSSVSSALNAIAGNLWDDILQHCLPTSLTKRGVLVSKILVIILGCISTGMCFFAVYFSGTTVFQLSYSVAGMLAIPIHGMICLGILCPWINTKGIVAGGTVALAIVLWMSMGQIFSESFKSSELSTDISNCLHTPMLNQSTSFGLITTIPAYDTGSYYYDAENLTSYNIYNESGTNFLAWLYSISYLWYSALGLLIMFIVATVVSFITGKNKVSYTDSRLLSSCYSSNSLQANNLDAPDESNLLNKKCSEELISAL